jgi:L-arabinose 1-dehydrogenase [NAD(P)+]
MHVAITGAAGEVGRTVVDTFDTHRRTLFTHSDHADLDSQVLDTTDRDALVAALNGVDTLLHLAWATGESDGWETNHEINARMTVNVLEAARKHDLDRVVLTSSCHAFGMYNRDDTSAFESVVPDPATTVTPETPLRPDSYYGVAKATVEALASYYADRYGLDIVVLQIGWLLSRDGLRETRSGSDSRHRYARAMWLSPRDCRALFAAAVDAPLDRSPVFAHGISRNGDRYLSLTETMQCLDYRPQDDAAEELDR